MPLVILWGHKKTGNFHPSYNCHVSPPLLQVPQRWIQPLPHLHGNGASVQPNTWGTQTGSEPLSPGNHVPLPCADGFPPPCPNAAPCPLPPFPACPLHSVMSRFGPYLVFHRRRIRLSSEHGHHTSPLWIFQVEVPYKRFDDGPWWAARPRQSAQDCLPLWALVAAFRFSPLILRT